MTADHLKQLLENGVTLVFAKILNASHNVRGCCALELDRRKGFRMVEQNLKQIRRAVSGEGILLLQIREDRLTAVGSFGEQIITELSPEMEEETLQHLPRYDFSAKVHAQKLLKKLGFAR